MIEFMVSYVTDETAFVKDYFSLSLAIHDVCDEFLYCRDEVQQREYTIEWHSCSIDKRSVVIRHKDLVEFNKVLQQFDHNDRHLLLTTKVMELLQVVASEINQALVKQS